MELAGKSAVITGASSGLGKALAERLLAEGMKTAVCAPDAGGLADLASRPGVIAMPADVRKEAEMEKLAELAVREFGRIDIWVNNAGRDGVKLPFFMIPPEDFASTVTTNLIGLMNCNRVCMTGMYRQKGGWIWNMEGFGSNGALRPTAAVYGCTKYAVRYFTKAMVKELAKTPIKVGYLSPGIVTTDMIVPPPDQRGEAWQQSKKILNILADTVETVTPFLVEGMLAAKDSGTAVRWLTDGKVRWRFLKSLFVKRDVFGPLGA